MATFPVASDGKEHEMQRYYVFLNDSQVTIICDNEQTALIHEYYHPDEDVVSIMADSRHEAFVALGEYLEA